MYVCMYVCVCIYYRYSHRALRIRSERRQNDVDKSDYDIIMTLCNVYVCLRVSAADRVAVILQWKLIVPLLFKVC